MSAENPPAVPLDKQPVVRASDADRDRIADILREALAEGRLDPDEHAERVEAAYRAKTFGELEPLIRDLPAGQSPAAPVAAPVRGPAAGRGGHGLRVANAKSVVAVLSGASRQGRWRVGAKINVVAVFGGVELDLTEAIFEQQYVVINVTAICGGVEIKVPENVSLRSGGSGVMGGFEVRESESGDPGAPVVLVRGVAIWGGVEAKPVPGKRVRDLRDG
ncbi:DUF1707 SHOCT-like domain-containing protein [Streptomyces sp. NBC_01803]|uniref:DUF1707 SHOCT-like domain-containing protein n=1 Tax=Streptomyces sp. NBC_01803 TaxID=2975946 RepID=UPI002DD8E951|nr:DUF1707 domain-containing protein [Streptomyces sp. NBC_01803]WSA45972.1 DUF1707 domain-containing protein [Streptomyces sp. NBC_01803]